MIGTHATAPAAAGALPAVSQAGLPAVSQAGLQAVSQAGLPAVAVPLLTWSCFDPSLVQVVLTTREGGVSTGPFASLNLGLHVGDGEGEVLTNRGHVAEAMGVTLDDMVFCQQVHGRAVAIVDDADRGRGARSGRDSIPETDAMVTTSGAILAVMVADCVPIVLHDPVVGVLACVHAGWGGTVQGVTSAAVAAMREIGSNPADIVAGVGPAIAADAYQVGEDVADLARAAFGEHTPMVLRPDGTGRYLFDLVGAASLQLTGAGLVTANIHPSGAVTGPDTPFYSHRLDGRCGRFAVLARLLHTGSAA